MKLLVIIIAIILTACGADESNENQLGVFSIDMTERVTECTESQRNGTNYPDQIVEYNFITLGNGNLMVIDSKGNELIGTFDGAEIFAEHSVFTLGWSRTKSIEGTYDGTQIVGNIYINHVNKNDGYTCLSTIPYEAY
jgi:hypothetical protein